MGNLSEEIVLAQEEKDKQIAKDKAAAEKAAAKAVADQEKSLEEFERESLAEGKRQRKEVNTELEKLKKKKDPTEDEVERMRELTHLLATLPNA